MIVYKCASAYVQSFTTLKGKIDAINAIQDALLNQALVNIETNATENMSQYSLNDGQTVISATYRSSDQVMQDYRSYETLKEQLLAAYNNASGRMVRLVDHKSFPNGF
jgi:hypothetical protein